MGEGARSPRTPGEREGVLLRENGGLLPWEWGVEGKRWFLIASPSPVLQIENSTPPPGPATSPGEQRGESCLIVFLPCQRPAQFSSDFVHLPRDSSHLEIPGAFTSHLVLVLFLLAFSPPSSTLMSHSIGVQVRAFPQLRPLPNLGVNASSTAFLSPTGVDLGQGHPASSWQDSLFLFLAIFFFFWLLSI